MRRLGCVEVRRRQQLWCPISSRVVRGPWPSMATMSERISVADVAHVARLARLELTEDELARFTEQLGAVLEHAADVVACNTSGVEPTSHPLPLVNVLRDDVETPCLDRQVVLAQAPAAEDDRFRVPRILGEAP